MNNTKEEICNQTAEGTWMHCKTCRTNEMIPNTFEPLEAFITRLKKFKDDHTAKGCNQVSHHAQV